MYYDFFQLNENPFNVTADPDFFFSSKCHREAMSNLEYGIEQRKGILVVTGEIGTGKTTLCRKLLKQCDRKTKFAVILNPTCSDEELLQMIIHDFGIPARKQNRLGPIHTMNDFLISEANKGHNLVVMIDEAQQLTPTQLEQVRLLSNIETQKEKLLQIVLLGQPELYDKLQLPALRQIRQRIAVYFHMRHLEKADIKNYIYHRLTKAAINPNAMRIQFTEPAITAIYQLSRGSPRTINILCDRALLAGYVAETHLIDKPIITNCAKEILYCEHHRPSTAKNTEVTE